MTLHARTPDHDLDIPVEPWAEIACHRCNALWRSAADLYADDAACNGAWRLRFLAEERTGPFEAELEELYA